MTEERAHEPGVLKQCTVTLPLSAHMKLEVHTVATLTKVFSPSHGYQLVELFSCLHQTRPCKTEVVQGSQVDNVLKSVLKLTLFVSDMEHYSSKYDLLTWIPPTTTSVAVVWHCCSYFCVHSNLLYIRTYCDSLSSFQ